MGLGTCNILQCHMLHILYKLVYIIYIYLYTNMTGGVLRRASPALHSSVLSLSLSLCGDHQISNAKRQPHLTTERVQEVSDRCTTTRWIRRTTTGATGGALPVPPEPGSPCGGVRHWLWPRGRSLSIGQTGGPWRVFVVAGCGKNHVSS